MGLIGDRAGVAYTLAGVMPAQSERKGAAHVDSNCLLAMLR